jgi:hypothetical protein
VCSESPDETIGKKWMPSSGYVHIMTTAPNVPAFSVCSLRIAGYIEHPPVAVDFTSIPLRLELFSPKSK